MWWIIEIVIVSSVVSGLLSKDLAQRKGYEGFFWTGFFLSIWGLTYVAGLPVCPRQEIQQKPEVETVLHPTSKSGFAPK